MNVRILTLATLFVVFAGLVGFVVVQRIGTPAESSAVQVSSYGDQPTLGDPDAPVKLIMFENFMCEYCKAFEEDVLPRLKQEYIDTGKVEAYYINLAWGEEDATTAGLTGECVYRQDEAAFWPFKTAVYAAQGGHDERWATTENLLSIARDSAPELDFQELEACIQDERYQSEVERDLQLGDTVGVQGTPSFVVGNEGLQAPTFADLAAAIDRNLAGN